MGCDIHMVVEKRHQDRWVGVHAFPYGAEANCYAKHVDEDGPRAHVRWGMRERNYDLFAAIAGVRGEGPEPKGLPEDISDLADIEVERWGDDGHSHTWLPMNEAVRLFGIHQLGVEAWTGIVARMIQPGAAQWQHVGAVLEAFGLDGDAPLDDHRLIIWFDN